MAGRHFTLPSAGAVLTGGILSGESSGCGKLECFGGFCLDALGSLGSFLPHISSYFSSLCLSLAEDNGCGSRVEILG